MIPKLQARHSWLFFTLENFKKAVLSPTFSGNLSLLWTWCHMFKLQGERKPSASILHAPTCPLFLRPPPHLYICASAWFHHHHTHPHTYTHVCLSISPLSFPVSVFICWSAWLSLCLAAAFRLPSWLRDRACFLWADARPWREECFENSTWTPHQTTLQLCLASGLQFVHLI